MKNTIHKTALIFLLAFLSSFTLIAQVPEGIVYQAEARTQDGKILQNENLEVEVNILQGFADGALVWQGTHEIRTDKYGLFTLTIGEGVSSYNFSVIDWAHYAHFLNVRINYKEIWTDLGTTQFISVPYAIHAKTAEHAFSADEIDPIFSNSDAANITSNDITNLSNLSGVNTGDQDLSLSGNTLALTGDPTHVNLSSFMDNTDAQQLSIDENSISLTNGGSIDLPPTFDGDYNNLTNKTWWNSSDEETVITSKKVHIGFLMGPTEMLNVGGNTAITGDYKYYNPRTRHYNLGAADFERGSGWEYHVEDDYGWKSTSYPRVGATVQLPNGATVRRIWVWYLDNSPLDITVKFRKTPYATFHPEIIGEVSSSEEDFFLHQMKMDLDEKISNSNNRYTIVWDTEETTDNHRLFSIQIEYTISQL